MAEATNFYEANSLLFGKELARLPLQTAQPDEPAQAPVPLLLTLVHLAFLAAVVIFAHHPALFIALLLGFIGISQQPLVDLQRSIAASPGEKRTYNTSSTTPFGVSGATNAARSSTWPRVSSPTVRCSTGRSPRSRRACRSR
mgnify:CR=1 FL=1